MSRIRVLPPAVVNKIAAGEVVERPASVVKELMENSIDAGARRIDVVVEAGGCDLVRVCDDGCGIPADQLPLAVASHATSKIQDADDLFRIRTLGFRGEALASIAAVSRLRILSRTAESLNGAVMEVTGGTAGSVGPCGCPPGTTVEVRHLFYNTPVRRKFLRTVQTELGHVTEAFLRVALPHPSIHFTLRHGERLIHELPGVERWRDRLVAAFGEEVTESLIWIECDEGDIQVCGYVADPQVHRPNHRWQYFFLNGRYIRDRSLQHALQEAYRGLLMQGRYPVAFLRWTMPPEVVDVNVHPTKLEVRFQDGARIYSQLLSTIRNRFLASDLTVRVGATGGQESLQKRADGGGPRPMGPPFVAGAGRSMPAPERWESHRPPQVAPATPLRQTAATHPSPTSALLGPGTTPRTSSPSPPRHGLQIHNRYLVAESEEGLLVIDQHALHERILYEKLRQRFEKAELEVQPLLVPEPVTLGPAEAAVAVEHKDTLAQVGIYVEPFGGDSVLIMAYPAMLANFHPADVLRQAVEQIQTGQGRLSREQVLDELLHMMACKGAIKAGDYLPPEVIAELLEHRELCRDAHHCPHGRPTALVFTREELDKRFKRI